MHSDLSYSMSRLFAYARVSTTEQTTDNQLREITAAGFSIDRKRTVTESISGSVAAGQRPGFTKLLDRMEEGDVLVVTKLDRLGRNAMDVRSTVEKLAALGIGVHCLHLGGADLTSPAGRMTMQVLCAVAEFERDLLIERTQSGIERAKSEGKHMGRKHSLSIEQRADVRRRLAAGESVRSIASEVNTTRQTVMRIRALAASRVRLQQR
jgi:putative DNA-invertase from lambdoid prophage Rac